MAKLLSETLTNIFQLQRRLIELIDDAGATGETIFDRFGETSETLPELEEAQNAKERLTSSYSRLSTLVLRVAEYQPTAPNTVLNLLLQAIEQAQLIADASQASIIEIKRNWDLL